MNIAFGFLVGWFVMSLVIHGLDWWDHRNAD